MSTNSCLFVAKQFPSAPLKNGVGRYVCQLQRLTLKFCKSSGGSRGVREYIENDVVDFAKKNSGIVVYLKPRRHRGAVLEGEYLNGERKRVYVNNYSREIVTKYINLLSTQSGIPESRLKSTQETLTPSIQGPWSPFFNKDPAHNLVQYPCEELSKTQGPESATDQVIKIFKEQQGKEKNEAAVNQ